MDAAKIQELVASMPSLTAPAEEVAAWEREQERLAAADRRAKACIPARYTIARIGQCPDIAPWVESVEQGGTGWILLLGRNGCGKTYAACAALNALAATWSVRFATMQGILDAVKATYDGGGSESEAVAAFTAPHVLAIDDLGKETPTDWSLPVIFKVINRRYEAQRPTVITSNLDAADMMRRWRGCGDETLASAIVSRLREAQAVRLADEDRRARW